MFRLGKSTKSIVLDVEFDSTLVIKSSSIYDMLGLWMTAVCSLAQGGFNWVDQEQVEKLTAL